MLDVTCSKSLQHKTPTNKCNNCVHESMDRKLLEAPGVWFAFVVSVIVNSGFRDALFDPISSVYPVHVASVLFLVTVVVLVTSFFLGGDSGGHSWTDMLIVGATWFVLSFLFEMIVGRYLIGVSRWTMLANYNVMQGRLWLLVLLAELVSPLFFSRLPARARETKADQLIDIEAQPAALEQGPPTQRFGDEQEATAAQKTQSQRVVLVRDEWLAFIADVRNLAQAYEARARGPSLKRPRKAGAPAPSGRLFCSHCGTEATASDKFCRICGRSI